MPLSLSDDEYFSVMAAAPIHLQQRDDFLRSLAAELERHPVVRSPSTSRKEKRLPAPHGDVSA